MSANAFRSPLMQQFAAAARSQQRPPLVLSSHLGSSISSRNNDKKSKKSAQGQDIRGSRRIVVHENDNQCHTRSSTCSSLDSNEYEYGQIQTLGKDRNHFFRSRTSRGQYTTTAKQHLPMTDNNNTTRDISNTSTMFNYSHGADVHSVRKFQIRAKSTRAIADRDRDFDRETLALDDDNGDEEEFAHHQALEFQSMIQTRRTASAYNPIQEAAIPRIKDAITRAIRCAHTAPNHHRTEPTTYYRILKQPGQKQQQQHNESSSSLSSSSISISTTHQKLMNICYNVALWRILKSGKKSLEEAKKNAKAKRDKWRDTIGGYVVVSVGNQPIQDENVNEEMELALSSASSFEVGESANVSELSFQPSDLPEAIGTEGTTDRDLFNYFYGTIPVRAPQTERQLEDYASACASIQNMLLSLHSESYPMSPLEPQQHSSSTNPAPLKMGTKWATGPMIRCRAMRRLVGCKPDDALVGIVMIGDRKVITDQRDWRRKREFMGEVLRDL